MAEITCPMCGTTFDPQGQRTCAACPLQSGCQLVCCPGCGFELVDPERSGLAKAAKRLFAWTSKKSAGRSEEPSVPTDLK